MGNCNDNTEKDKEEQVGIVISNLKISCHKQISFPVSFCYRKRGIRKSVESGKKERSKAICNEGNV